MKNAGSEPGNATISSVYMVFFANICPKSDHHRNKTKIFSVSNMLGSETNSNIQLT